MSRIDLSMVAIALFATLGCGGAQPSATGPQQETAPGGAVSVATGDPGVEAAGDLTPVAAPKELIAVARVRDVQRLLDVFGSWSRYPIDVVKLAEKERPGLSRILRLDAPVDVALALDPAAPREPEPFAVVSVGLASLEGAVAFARDEGKPVDEIRAGVFSAGDDCLIARAVGTAPARLICGDSQRDLDALAEYVARGLPAEHLSDADLFADVRAEPIRRLYGNQLRRGRTVVVPMVLNELQLGEPRFDRALADAVHAVADEVLALVEDLDRLTVDATVHSDAQTVDTRLSLKFRGSSSWVAQTTAAMGRRAGPPPAVFWSLPKDASTASYSVGADPRPYERILSTAVELVDGALAKQQVPPRVRNELVGLARKLFISDAASSYAGGSVQPQAARLKEREGPAFEREMARVGVGWHLVGIEEPAKRWLALLTAADKTYNSRSLRAFMKKEGADLAELAKLKRRAAGRKLPRGSVMWELVIPGKVFEPSWVPKGQKRVKGRALSVYLVVVPEGGRTWLGVSADKKLLLAKLAQVVAKAPSSGKLEARSELAKLRSLKAVSGGFFSLSGVTDGLAMVALREELGKDAETIFGAMPHRGETPIFFSTRVEPGRGPTVVVTASAPRAVVEDITSVAGLLAR